MKRSSAALIMTSLVVGIASAGLASVTHGAEVDQRAMTAPSEGELLSYTVRGDAVPEPLGALEGKPARGKAIVLDRRRGNCLICHSFPVENEPFQGELGPPMAGVASRLTEGQIRLRLIDQTLINPETIMPPYYRVKGLTNVAPAYRGESALSAQEIEDVVAYLATLTD